MASASPLPANTTTPNPPTTSPAAFSFPPEYSFPPFFTRQTNLTTHHAQLTKWAALVLAYCRHYRILKLSLSGDASSTLLPPPEPSTTAPTPNTSTSTTATLDTTTPTSHTLDTTDLFHNARLNRRLSHADIRAVIDFLRKDGRAEYIIPSSSSAAASDSSEPGKGDMAWIYWRTPEEWASLVEGWVDGTGKRGSVLTVWELVQGDETLGAEFHGLDEELLLKALNVLVKRGKAQIMVGQDGAKGVKIF